MDQTKHTLVTLLAAFPAKKGGDCSWGTFVVSGPGLNDGCVVVNIACSAANLHFNGIWQRSGAYGDDPIVYRMQWDYLLNLFRALRTGTGTTFIEIHGRPCDGENRDEYLKKAKRVAGPNYLMANQRGGATTKTNVKAAKEKNPEEFADEVAKVIMLKSEGLSTASCSGAARTVAGRAKGGAKGAATTQANARAAATANAAIWENMSSNARSAAMESMRAQLVEDKQVFGARCLGEREKVAWDHMTPEEKRACQLSIASEIKRRRV